MGVRQYGKSVLIQMAAEAGIPVCVADTADNGIDFVILDESEGRSLAEGNNRVIPLAQCGTMTIVVDGEQAFKVFADLIINGDPRVERPAGMGIKEIFGRSIIHDVCIKQVEVMERRKGPRKRGGKWVPRHQRWS